MEPNLSSPHAVSVIIPAYNRAEFISTAIESALKQTRAPHEVIVVDDGSTDHTTGILAGYSPPVRVIRQENRGRSAARNTGLRAATGDAVIFLDSDDLLVPSCLERCVQVLERQPEIDVVYGDAYLCDESGKRLGRHSQFLPGPRPSGMILAELARRNFLTISSLIRRSSLGDATFDKRLDCAEDYDFWRQLAGRCCFQYVDEPLMCYRFHAAMTVSSRHFEALAAEVDVQRRILAMPEFDALPRQARARSFCSHGIKQAMVGRSAAARTQFWRAIRTSPLYAGGYALLLLSLLGDRAFGYAIHNRRRLAGNKLGTRTDHRLGCQTLRVLLSDT